MSWPGVKINTLILSLHVFLERRGDIITPNKKVKTDPVLSTLVFSFTVERITSNSPFEDVLSQLRDRILTLSHVIIFLGSSFEFFPFTMTGGISNLVLELGLMKDTVGINEDMSDVPLCLLRDNSIFVSYIT